MKKLLSILSLLTVSENVRCSEKEICISSLPTTPPIAIPKAPWIADFYRYSDLAVRFSVLKAQKNALEERAKRAKEQEKNLDSGLLSSSESSSESSSDDELNSKNS